MPDPITASRPRWQRAGAAAGAVVAAVTSMVLASASPAAAHHGWDGFDTDNLVYLAGTVSSDGSWGEPHSYFDVAVDPDLPADTPELTIPEQLQHPEDSIRVESALSYSGAEEGLEVIIAPPAWSGRWGLDRALEVGERFQAVGYVDRTDTRLFRPVVFWYGDDEIAVNQVLGDTLPVRAPLPGAAEPSEAAAPPGTSETSTADDPLETPAPSADADTPEQDGGGSAVVWAVTGAVVVAGIVGGWLYLRRRTGES